MPKPVSPLVGFNNNVKHKGRIFHVQTEDSGIHRPRIVTHLFADGGRIIRSTKTDYSEHVGRRDMVAIVRRLMKEQHKAMFIALRDGQFDSTIAEICGDEQTQPAVASGAKATNPATPLRPAQPPPKPAAPSQPSGSRASGERNAAETAALRRASGRAPPPVPRRPAPTTLNDHTLAGIAAPPEAPPSAVVQRDSEAPGRRKPAPKGGTPLLGTLAVDHGSGRYAAPRPAAIFSEPPAAESASIFGGSSISEQSLDEVILSYLAEDLEGPPTDK